MTEQETVGSRPARRDRLWLLAVTVVVALVWLPAASTGFAGDDFLILSRLSDTGGLAQPLAYFRQSFFDYYRPLTFLSYAADWRVWGLGATGFHLTSVALHALNAALVFVLARRFTGPRGAALAALLFGLHPAAHEAVYWVAARFDLLSTTLTLGAVLLLTRGRGAYAIGLLLFFGALLAKESAVAVLVLVPAYDAIIRKHDVRAIARSLLPIGLVAVIYAVIRWNVIDASAAAGGARLPKLFVLVASMAVVLWFSTRTRRTVSVPPSNRGVEAALLLLTPAALLALTLWPPMSGWVREKLGFVTFAVFYLLSPVVLPPPPAEFFSPDTVWNSAPALLIVSLTLGAFWIFRRRVAASPVPMFCLVFTAATLIPVLSLTGSSRYVYTGSAGLACLAGWGYERLRASRRRIGAALASLVLVIFLTQVVTADSAWRWGSRMTTAGLAVMEASAAPCGQDDILMLTTPVAIRGVYCNFYWDAFKVTSPCPPASFQSLLRAVRVDPSVAVRALADDTIELRVASYTGSVVASTDLRHFDHPIAVGERTVLSTAVGPLETFPEGDAQVFRWTRTGAGRTARLFYYSEGAVHPF